MTTARNDFNGDGKSDILFQHTVTAKAGVWWLDGTRIVNGSYLGPIPNSDVAWHVKGSGDFNGDGKWDVVWQHDDGRAAVWLVAGTTPTALLGADQVGGDPGAGWNVIGSGDFNGDGKSDILWQNDDGRAAVWLLNGLSVIGADQVGSDPGPGWNVKDSGDFNGDGKSDILWQNDDGRAAVWLLDGLNVIGGDQVGGNPGAGWDVRGSGDFNGDGKSDILWQNTDGRAAIWLMNGTVLIDAAEVGNNNDPSWQVQGAGDYDGNGKSDIMWADEDVFMKVWFMDGFTLTGEDILRNPLGHPAVGLGANALLWT